MKLYIGNLSKTITNEGLKEAFAPYGNIVSANVIFDRMSQESKGFGFVELESAAEGQKAITGMNGKDLKGRSIVVNEARPKTENRSFGSGRGR